MPIVLYDTWERALRPFTPLQADQVGLYCCGPTVYDYAHLGNLRTYVFEDLLRRVLQHGGHNVRHVVNITDVGHLVSDADDGEDKMEKKGSRRAGASACRSPKKNTPLPSRRTGARSICWSQPCGVKPPSTSASRLR